MVCWW